MEKTGRDGKDIAEERKKILLDTDIGDDIDDAFALSLILSSPELDLVGVTTVFRNAKKRGQMAKTLMRSFGVRDIPVCAGCDDPLIAAKPDLPEDRRDEEGKFIPCQYGPEMADEQLDSRDAVDFIIEMAKKHPGEIELVPIGPLTNIALALRKCPQLPSLLHGITLMGGCFYEDQAEWNIWCDPEAARIVFTSGARVRAAGLDVTLPCKLRPEQVRRFTALSSGSSKLLSEMMRKWAAGYDCECPILFDPLTVAVLIDPSFVMFEERPVLVSLEKQSYGKTLLQSDALADEHGVSVIGVGKEVQSERFLHFFEKRIFH